MPIAEGIPTVEVALPDDCAGLTCRPDLHNQSAANARAWALLDSLLTAAQRTQLATDGAFAMTGSQGGRFRISNRGRSHNVYELDTDGFPIATLCAYPRGVPLGDVLAAQLLTLRRDEPGFRRVANRSSVWEMPAWAPTRIPRRRRRPARRRVG